MKRNNIRYIAVFLILGIGLLATGCSVQDKQIISCDKLLDADCSDNDCSAQCADYASNNGKQLRSSDAINGGQGCECFMEVVN